MKAVASRLRRRNLGRVITGSLSEGLEVRLERGISVEDMAVGRYVVIVGEKRQFFGMVTDVRLETSNPLITVTPPDIDDPFIAEVIAGTSTFGTLSVMPMLTVGTDVIGQIEGPQPVKTVPSHFAPVAEATEEDVATVFGREDDRHFSIGQPLDMETKICLDLGRLVERSSGVFGKSGTGKTFLTRLLLVGIAQKKAAVNLVFDMHNEYGDQSKTQDGKIVKGLRQLLPGRVVIFTLDEESSRARGTKYDFPVEIGYDQVQPEDIAMLQEALSLSDAAIETVYRLGRFYSEEKWLQSFLELGSAEEMEELGRRLGLNPGTLQVLRRKLDTRLVPLKFFKERALRNSVQEILSCLDRGQHVVLEFGRHSKLDAYILVANVLTRRIHERYVVRKEEALGGSAPEPRPLVITIEEAHKFLSPKVAGLTVFGTIARELRKYNVTLLVVDQRPSGIADEVMSQIGTRATCLLDDEKDIAAVLSGIPNVQSLRAVLAKLDSKQQALILGHAVPMPVVVRVREYGTVESYRELQLVDGMTLAERAKKDGEELFD